MKLVKPSLLIDKEKCLRNLNAMINKAVASSVTLRPHCKTHQSTTIAQWYAEAGIKQITVSSVSMANYFIAAGWKDITIAFPLNLHEIEELNKIEPTINLNLLLSCKEASLALANQAKREFGVFIKADTGYKRSGFTVNQLPQISELISLINTNKLLHFKGFLSHFGNTYQARNLQQIKKIYEEGVLQLLYLKNHFSDEFPGLEISVGDTPSCSLLTDLMSVTEIRPGNFIFYDLMQQQIGSCTFDQISIALACPVIEVHPERNEAIIYGGAVHLSKDYIIDSKGDRIFGLPCLLTEKGWSAPLDGCYLKNLSQEHGILHFSEEMSRFFKPGNWIAVLPVHSCLTADVMGQYVTLKGELIPMMKSSF